MNVSVWEAIFMLLVLKIPIIYLSVVVWYAVRAEPEPEPAVGGEEVAVLTPLTPCGWDDWKRRRPRPHGLRPRPTGPRLPARARTA